MYLSIAHFPPQIDGSMRQLSFKPLQPHAVSCVCYTTRDEMVFFSPLPLHMHLRPRFTGMQVTGSADGSICVWRSGKVIHYVSAHTGTGTGSVVVGVTAVASAGGGVVWSCGGDGCLVKWAVDASAKEVLVMGEVYALADLLRGPVTLLHSQLAATSLAVRPGYCTPPLTYQLLSCID